MYIVQVAVCLHVLVNRCKAFQHRMIRLILSRSLSFFSLRKQKKWVFDTRSETLSLVFVFFHVNNSGSHISIFSINKGA